jgi:hypothetical protein
VAAGPDFAAGPELARERLAGCLAEATAALAEFDSNDEGFLVGVS